jgi:hypothetical protein
MVAVAHPSGEQFRLVCDEGEAGPVSPARRRFQIVLLGCAEPRMESYFGGAI